MASPLRTLRARVLKAFFGMHASIYEKSDGRIGSWLLFPTLLLSTRGRKSGLWRTTPLVYFTDGRSLVVVGSDGGARRDPQWWKNLQVDPVARVRAGRRVFEAHARLAEGDERARLWDIGRTKNPAWANYQKSCPRQLPVVVLTPVGV